MLASAKAIEMLRVDGRQLLQRRPSARPRQRQRTRRRSAQGQRSGSSGRRPAASSRRKVSSSRRSQLSTAMRTEHSGLRWVVLVECWYSCRRCKCHRGRSRSEGGVCGRTQSQRPEGMCRCGQSERRTGIKFLVNRKISRFQVGSNTTSTTTYQYHS